MFIAIRTHRKPSPGRGGMFENSQGHVAPTELNGSFCIRHYKHIAPTGLRTDQNRGSCQCPRPLLERGGEGGAADVRTINSNSLVERLGGRLVELRCR